jgi:hypothetical protein
MALLVGIAVTVSALVVQGTAAVLGVEAINALMARRAVGTVWRDIVMSPRWRLLGPQETANGTLAFGWSTAAIVTVVIRLVRHRHRIQVGRESRRGT